MEYVRIYADDAGETHFENVAPELIAERYAGAEWLISQPLRVEELWFRRVTTDFPDGRPHAAPRAPRCPFPPGVRT